MICAFLHEFPFFKIKQQVGNCFTRYLQRREKQFPDKQFFYLLRNRNECGAWILKHLQYRTSHMALKKSNLGIHDASKHLNREINSQLNQIIFDLGIHNCKQDRGILATPSNYVNLTTSCTPTPSSSPASAPALSSRCVRPGPGKSPGSRQSAVESCP